MFFFTNYICIICLLGELIYLIRAQSYKTFRPLFRCLTPTGYWSIIIAWKIYKIGPSRAPSKGPCCQQKSLKVENKLNLTRSFLFYEVFFCTLILVRRSILVEITFAQKRFSHNLWSHQIFPISNFPFENQFGKVFLEISMT